MPEASLYKQDGSSAESIELPVEFFGAEISEGAVYYTVKAYLANQRQGTHRTKTRSEVSGSGAKPWKQKGTGRARAGSNSSPIWVRGNKAHGPKPHKYIEKVNRKVRLKALRSALTSKASDGKIKVFESLAIDAPKTSSFVKMMESAGIAGTKNLYLVSEKDVNILVSSKNVEWAKVMRVSDVNTYSVLQAGNVIFSKSALEQFVGGDA